MAAGDITFGTGYDFESTASVTYPTLKYLDSTHVIASYMMVVDIKQKLVPLLAV